MDSKNEEIKKKSHPIPPKIWMASAGVIIVVIILIVLLLTITNKKEEKEIITQSTLEKIVNVSELSTYEVIYNGVAKVMNETKPEKVDYYVSYESKVKAGIDFEQIEINVDNEAKKISVTLPEIKITDVNVDITTLDYIFENEKANTSTVSQEAYKACIEDVTNESASKNAIYKLAEKNAENMIEALISPFVKQLDAEYVVEIN